MFVRLELALPEDFDLSLRQLKAFFPKLDKVIFPFKLMKGDSWYGFNFYKTNLLLDWSSISKWCNVESMTNQDDNCCRLFCSPKSAEVLVPCLPIISDLIRLKREEINCEFKFYLAKRKSRFELELRGEDDRLAIIFKLDSLKARHVKSIEVMNQVLIAAVKKFPLLKQVAFEFKERIRLTGPKKHAFISVDENSIKLIVNGSAGIKSSLKKAFEFAVNIRDLFDDWGNSFSLQLFPDEAPKIAKAFNNCDANSTIHFEGCYHPNFHPDQLLKEFPLEGFWELPLFDVKTGRQFYETVRFHLIQTPKERFFEVQVSDEVEMAKLKQWLKPKKALQTYNGPTEKRWNLHKLQKKK